MSDIKDRILAAIATFVENGGSQTKIILSRTDYKSLYCEAVSTPLGRAFVKAGFKLYQLDVFCYNGNDIVIA